MASDLIFITGVSGYVGFHTLVLALESGYKVRAVIRKESQIGELKATLVTRLKESLIANVQFVVISDLGTAGAFDGLLQDVVYILHIASPMNTLATDNYKRDYFRPAIDNSINILEAASKVSSVKRIVITSSIGAILDASAFATGALKKEPYTSDDEVPHYPIDIQLPHPLLAYGASKSMALEAAESWVSTNSPSFTVIYLLPPLILGPNYLAKTVAAYEPSSNGSLIRLLQGKQAPMPALGATVGISDVTKVHLKALDESVPEGRYVFGGSVRWADVQGIVERLFPEEKKIKSGGSLATLELKVDGRKTEEAFGINFQGIEDQVKSVVEYYLTLE